MLVVNALVRAIFENLNMVNDRQCEQALAGEAPMDLARCVFGSARSILND